MMKILMLGTACALLLASPGEARPPATIQGTVGVCDPWYPDRCAAPDSSGNLPITVGSLPLPTGAATVTNQTAVQADPGSDASKAVAVQGVTGGKAVNVNPDNVADGPIFTGTVSSATTMVTISNTAGYGYFTFAFTAVGGGATVVVDAAPDGVNFVPVQYFTRVDALVIPAPSLVTPTTAMQFVVPVTAPAMRIRLAAWTSGTYTVYATLKRGSPPVGSAIGIVGTVSAVTTVATLTGGGVASGAADSGNPNKIGCKYNSTPVAVANGNRVDCQAEPNGAILTEEGGRSYSHINSNATTAVKGSAGYLHTICVNTAGASANTATTYDNTAGSGTVIGVIDTTAKGCYTYDLNFATGLTIVTATGTAPDMTVTFR